MLALGKYHARDIHTWEDGQCDFQDKKKCSCGSCEEDDVQCEGEDYHSKNSLTCPFHALAYEVECHSRASQASQIIHPELGQGHSNYPEASHNVLIRFRSKDKYLRLIHYTVSTNMGLMQANMTWLCNKKGLSYHWLLDLLQHLKLPVFDGMKDTLQRANEIRAKNLEQKQTEEAKQQRTNWKKAHVQEQEERKQWIRKQRILHTYGSDNDDTDELSEGDDTFKDKGVAPATITTSKKGKCKCSSTSHRYSSHRECPLNKKKQQETEDVGITIEATSGGPKATSSEEVSDKASCICKSDRASHQRNCPLNPRNITRPF